MCTHYHRQRECHCGCHEPSSGACGCGGRREQGCHCGCHGRDGGCCCPHEADRCDCGCGQAETCGCERETTQAGPCHRREHGAHARHAPRFGRRFRSRAERLAELEAYLADLQAETRAVEEHIAELKAVAA